MSAEQPNVLVTGAGGVTARSIARALLQSGRFPGVRLFGTDAQPQNLGYHEHLYEGVWQSVRSDDPAYWPEMEFLTNELDIDAVLVVPELEVLAWAANPRTPAPAVVPPLRLGALAGDKGELHRVLQPHGLVPTGVSLASDELVQVAATGGLDFPVWLRPHHFGVSSGTGAFVAHEAYQVEAWTRLHPDVSSWQVSELVSGKNLAVAQLYDRGSLLRSAIYERLEYFMSRLVPTGVTGNISEGTLICDPAVDAQVEDAIRLIEAETGEQAHGLLTTDLMLRANGRVAITEVNLRATACISSFTQGGYDIAGDWLALTLGQALGEPTVGQFPPGNRLLRDIDGVPAWLAAPTPIPTISAMKGGRHE